MAAAYRLLQIEDSAADADLVCATLRHAGLEFSAKRVKTEQDYVTALGSRLPDLIVCDYSLAEFSAERALDILHDLKLDIPFLVVSQRAGERATILALQFGSSGFLRKGQLPRLARSIESALDERSQGAQRVTTQAVAASQGAHSSATMQRNILDSLDTQIAMLDGDGSIVSVNKAWEALDSVASRSFGRQLSVGSNYLDALREGAGEIFPHSAAEDIKAVLEHRSSHFSFEFEIAAGDSTRWYAMRVTPLSDSAQGGLVSHEEITGRMLMHIALRDVNKRLQSLSKRVLTVQEEERRNISRELHDDIGQSLSALKIGLHRLSQCPAEQQAKLQADCLEIADISLNKLRQLSHELRPPQLDQLGLEDALRWLVERQRSTSGIDIVLHCNGLTGRRIPATLESACYRITQEGLNNATRHAKATSIMIHVEKNDRLLKLAIRDDGAGFDEQAARQRALKSGSLGLISMEERAQLAGGRMKLRTVLGGGTTISAVFALDNTESEPLATHWTPTTK